MPLPPVDLLVIAPHPDDEAVGAGGIIQQALTAGKIDGATYPIGVPWPPPIRVPLTTAESTLKLRAIAAHVSQCAVDAQYLESFVKSEEVFWKQRTQAL